MIKYVTLDGLYRSLPKKKTEEELQTISGINYNFTVLKDLILISDYLKIIYIKYLLVVSFGVNMDV